MTCRVCNLYQAVLSACVQSIELKAMCTAPRNSFSLNESYDQTVTCRVRWRRSSTAPRYNNYSDNNNNNMSLRDRHWLPIQQRVDYKLCMMVHRCLSGSAPSYLVDLIMPSAVANTRAGLRSAEAKTVSVPRTYSSLGDRAFAVAAPRTWNKLPFVLRNTTSVGSFSRKLKTFLFNSAFSSFFFKFRFALMFLCIVC